MKHWLKLLRRVAQRLLAECLARTGFMWFARRGLRARGAVIVMVFHRVLDERARRTTNSLPGMIVRERTFEALAGYVAKRYEAVDLASSEPAVRASKVRFAFTFDDGWRDNADTMLPIAKRHGIPTAVFVCTGIENTSVPFWPERLAARMKASDENMTMEKIETAIERLKVTGIGLGGQAAEEDVPGHICTSTADRRLSETEIEAMHDEGVRFGAHTRTHVILPRLNSDQAWSEIAGSKGDLEQLLQAQCDMFAYPNGDVSHEIREKVIQAGFRMAFTTKRGAWTADCDRFLIPRTCVWEACFVGLRGNFSKVMFEYAVIWRAWRATAARLRSRAAEREYTIA